ncbi:hypothetical protein IPA_01060 [Ignicoccus pacificus DSM 13166]|uniref:Uncharacterized protein n=1 Tax=Ignicoccus pacificus DSM 13166 TaxID=940294 RepID=A0A977KAF6_9CREN|nr:hypothetical protein IPA_01060 [Ignicoccus pacificus DSM 13166]
MTARPRFAPSRMGLCPLVIAMEEIDHEEQRRFVKLYDVETGKMYDIELPYNQYLLSELKGMFECWERVFEELKVKWECERKSECPLMKKLNASSRTS